MLQQTTFSSALPYYQAFLKKFPSVDALAEASEEQVLKAWEGLGYYARARSLHRAARQIIASGNAQWPQNADEWKAVPGVGPYTAAALSSVLNGERVAVVDGNVARVFARFYLLSDDFSKLPARQKLADRLKAEIDCSEVPGNFNQAMMELGALVCTPRKANCAACPLQKDCQARKKACVADYPVKATKKVIPVRKRHVVIIRDDAGHVLLVRNSEGGLLKGLWELPACEEGTRVKHVYSHFIQELAVSVVKSHDVAFCDLQTVPLAGSTKKALHVHGLL